MTISNLQLNFVKNYIYIPVRLHKYSFIIILLLEHRNSLRSVGERPGSCGTNQGDC